MPGPKRKRNDDSLSEAPSNSDGESNSANAVDAKKIKMETKAPTHNNTTITTTNDNDGISIKNTTITEDQQRREHLQHMQQIEDEFKVLKNKLYTDKVEALDKEIYKLENHGRNEKYENTLKDLDLKKLKNIQVAEYFRKCKIDSINANASFNRILITQETKKKQQKLYEKMQTSCLQVRSTLDALREKTLLSNYISNVQTKYNLHMKRKSHMRFYSDNHSSRYPAVMWPYIVYNLEDSEIGNDLLLIKKMRKLETKNNNTAAAKRGVEKLGKKNVTVNEDYAAPGLDAYPNHIPITKPNATATVS